MRQLVPLRLGLNKGQVRVELYDLGTTKFISAHDSDLVGLYKLNSVDL
jgi:hypothetical protein